MPKKKSFAKEAIVNASFKIVREQGWAKLSARTLARELNSSTMPIYSCIRSMEEIEREVRVKAFELLRNYHEDSYADNPIQNLAVGYILFAKEEVNLFRFLFIERPQPLLKDERIDLWKQLQFKTGEDIPREHHFGNIAVEGMDDIMLKSWIFSHGLAVVVNYGLLQEVKRTDITRLLNEVSEAFTFWGWQAKKRHIK